MCEIITLHNNRSDPNSKLKYQQNLALLLLAIGINDQVTDLKDQRTCNWNNRNAKKSCMLKT